jgi:hypothetical protein
MTEHKNKQKANIYRRKKKRKKKEADKNRTN